MLVFETAVGFYGFKRDVRISRFNTNIEPIGFSQLLYKDVRYPSNILYWSKDQQRRYN